MFSDPVPLPNQVQSLPPANDSPQSHATDATVADHNLDAKALAADDPDLDERDLVELQQLNADTTAKNAADATATAAVAVDTKAKKKDDESVPMVGVFRLFHYADARDRLLMLIGIVGAVAYGIAMPSLSLILGDIIGVFTEYQVVRNLHDAGVPGYDDPRLASAQDTFSTLVRQKCLIFLGIGVATMVACYIMQACWMISGERQAMRVRSLFIRAVMRQDTAWFDNHPAGDLTTKLTSDTLMFQEGVSEKIALAISYMCQFITGFTIAFIKSWRLTVVLLATLPLFAISGAVVGKAFANGATRSQVEYGKAGAIAQEVLSNIRTVVAFGGQKRAQKKFTALLENAVKVNVHRAWVTGAGFGVFFGLLYGMFALAFWYGARLKNQGVVGVGEVLSCLFAITIGTFSLINIGPAMQAISKGRGAASNLFEVIESFPSIDSVSDQGLKPESFTGHVQFVDVKFAYPSRPNVPVLRQFNLTIDAGKTVALVGFSGSGKSTIIQLLERYYDVNAGEILIDGTPIGKLNLRYFRQSIGLVSQEPVLFDATIEQNIRYGAPDGVKVTTEMIEHACRMANAHDFISRLPEGYNTMVGEKGALLSGGQKQRIAIARALIKDPKILLLDEATSALDTESERSVQEALDKAAVNRTTIVIAHRLSTIKAADVIVVMSSGEVVEVGSHNELLQRQGQYYELVQAQQLKTLEESGRTADIADEPRLHVDLDVVSGALPSADLVPSSPISAKAPKPVDAGAVAPLNPQLEALAKEEAEKAEEKRILKEKSVSIMRVLRMQTRDMGWLVFGIIAAALNGILLPFFGILLGRSLAAFSAPDAQQLTNRANTYAIVFTILMFANFFINVAQTGALGITGERLTKHVRSTMFAAMLRQEISWFDDKANGTGNLTSRLSEQADRIQGLTGPNAANIIQLTVSMVTAISVAMYYGWKMALCVLAATPVIAIGSVFESQVITNSLAPTRLIYASAAQTACDAIQNIGTVKSLTQEHNFVTQYLQSIKGPYKAGIKKAAIGAWGFGFSQAVQFWVYGLAFYVGYRFVLSGDMDTEGVFNTLFVILFGSISFSQAATFGPNLAKAKLAAILYFELIDRVPPIDIDNPEGLKPVDVEGRVAMQDVKFSYPQRKDAPILRGLTLDFPPGQVIALVGPSGAGKSSVMGMVQRFYEVDSGETSVEGYDVRKWNLEYLRENLAVVAQEPSLFIGTIAENIAYSKPDATEEEIVEAAKMANIHAFIMKLPDQYQTSVANTQLSGGQKQRVAIARALLRQPKILLLDEATSALDSESEKLVQKALDRASQGRTTITIAHRLSTIQNADMIFVLSNGVLVEQGKHFDLLEQRGVYYKLVQKQQLGTN
ncbi:hypothetical protein RI367_002663 [Sorochytrium milnesiophthora]